MNTNTSVLRTVRDLQVGDLLSSGLVILARPYKGVNTPRGKSQVYALRLSSGVKGWRTWNSSTVMLVTPAPSCFILDEKALDNPSQD